MKQINSQKDNWPKLTHKKIENFNILITSKIIELVIKFFPQKAPAHMANIKTINSSDIQKIGNSS